MPKSIPQRQCVGCREKKPKPELIRVVRAPDGAISLDARGKAAGRGAYLCPKAVCLKKAQKNRALERAVLLRLFQAHGLRAQIRAAARRLAARIERDGPVGRAHHPDQLRFGLLFTAADTLPLGNGLGHG